MHGLLRRLAQDQCPRSRCFSGYAVGPRPKDKAINWLRDFCLKSHRPLIFQMDGEWIAYGPPQFQTEMAKRLSNGEHPWSGEHR